MSEVDVFSLLARVVDLGIELDDLQEWNLNDGVALSYSGLLAGVRLLRHFPDKTKLADSVEDFADDISPRYVL